MVRFLLSNEKAGKEGNWWHAWGGVILIDEFEGDWATVILGPSIISPEEVESTEPVTEVTALGLNYLTTWDHEPSEAEKEKLIPEEYRD